MNAIRMFFFIFSHSFHVMIESAIIYMCAATPEFGKRQPYAFLDEVVI